MIEVFFKQPAVVRRHRAGPLGSYIDSFAKRLREKGYAHFTVRHQIRVITKLGKWLARRKVLASELNSEKAEEFAAHRRRYGRLREGDVATLKQFLQHLTDIGAISSPTRKVNEGPIDQIEQGFREYLEQQRALEPTTVKRYLQFARRFLSERFGKNPIKLSRLTGRDITAYVSRYAYDYSSGTAKLMVTALRNLFRFLRMQGEISTDLAACVPTVANWRSTTLPNSVEPEEVKKLLRSCDRRTSDGRRDYAVLLLLARLGLRAGEVAALTLDDINWDTGELTIRGKRNRQDRLPLPSDVGKALAAYLKNGRPTSSSRRLFIRSKAPLTGFADGSAVSTIVRRAFARAGIYPPHRGAHILRHSLATMMLRKGASLREIGEVLRHQHPDTTTIYAKVDLASLRTIARPWLGGRS